MSDSHFVARTAKGLEHFNTLVLRKLWTVVVFLDAPSDQEEYQDSYQLISDSGLYDRTMQRSEAVREDEAHLALRFTEVVPQGTYSLYQRLACGVEFPVFLSVPFSVLEDHGAATEEPESEDWEPPTFQSEPELTSGDPLLLHHEDDHAEPELVADWEPLGEDTTDPTQPKEAIA